MLKQTSLDTQTATFIEAIEAMREAIRLYDTNSPLLTVKRLAQVGRKCELPEKLIARNVRISKMQSLAAASRYATLR